MAMDVYGGYGYCSGISCRTILRDEKIATIYEGTNGIQALDLVGRKLGQRKGANIMNLAGMIQANYRQNENQSGTRQIGLFSGRGRQCLSGIDDVFRQVRQDRQFLIPVLNACKFLELFGDVIVGHFLLDAAGIALKSSTRSIRERRRIDRTNRGSCRKNDKEAAFYSGKIASAKFFANDILTSVKARCEAIKMADKTPLEICDEAFSY